MDEPTGVRQALLSLGVQPALVDAIIARNPGLTAERLSAFHYRDTQWSTPVELYAPKQVLTDAQSERALARLAEIGARTDCLMCQSADLRCLYDRSTLFRICARCGFIHFFELAAFGWRTTGGTFHQEFTLIDLPSPTQAE